MENNNKINKRISLEYNTQELSDAESQNKSLNHEYVFETHVNRLNQTNKINGIYGNKQNNHTGNKTSIVFGLTPQIKIPEDDIKPEDSSEDEEIQGNEKDLDKSYPKKKPILKKLAEEEKIPNYKQVRDTKLIGKFCDVLKKQKILSDPQINIVINLINNKSSTIPDFFNRSFLSSLSHPHNITNFLLDLYQYRNLRKYIFCQEAGIQQNVLDGIKIAAISCLSNKV